jgi:tetratricopeptide (TPR) repeat protein
LETLYGVGVSAHAAELAYHYAQAQGFAGTGKLIRYCLPAGEQALAGYAYEEAVTHFRRGLAAKEDSATDGETAALLFGLGRAQAATLQRHQLGEALGNLSRAFDYYAQIGDVPRAVAVAEYPLPVGVGHRAEVSQLIERALALVPPDSHEAGRLLSNYGRVLGAEEGDYDRAQQAFGRAVAIAQQQGDASLEMRTLGHGARIDAYNHQWEASLEKSLRAVELAERIDNIRAEVESRYRAASALHVMGDLQTAARHAARSLDLAERLRDHYWLATALWCNENACRIRGDWQSAREFSDRGLAIWATDPRLLGTRALLEYEVGSFDAGAAYLDRLMKAASRTTPGPSLEYSMVACIVPLVAHITGVPRELEVAEKAAKVVLSTPSATSGMANDVRGGLALLAVHRSDVTGARNQYSALESERGHMLFTSIGGDRLLGLLARTMGKLDGAIAHLEDGLAFCRNAAYPPELAWACFDCADTLLQRDGPGDRTRAITLLDETLTIARDLGMRPLLERVLALKLKIQGISSIDLKTSIDTVALEVEREQPDLRSHAAPDGTVTILFSDIEGSTTMTERLGDRRMQEVLREHNAVIRRQARSHGGFEVKSMGDGFMLAFSSARRGLQCAIAIQHAFTVYN